VNDLSMMAAAALAAAVLVLAAVFVAARRDRRRRLDEPTDMLPILEDPIALHFDEAARLLRGECDPEIAAIYDRERLHPYEGDFRTRKVRRLTRRLERLPQT
jgi:hypothetical protein